MNKPKFIKTASCAVVVFLITLAFNNCGAPKHSSYKLGSEEPTSLITKTSNDRHYTIQSAGQLSESFKAVTGVSYTGAITNEINRQKPLMTENYKLDSVTSPMMIAITNLSSRFCDEMLTQESRAAAANRKFFPNVNFSAGISSNGQAVINKATENMATEFLGRKLSSEEKTIFSESYTEFVNALPSGGANTNSSTRNILLFNCSSLLSSFDFVTI